MENTYKGYMIATISGKEQAVVESLKNRKVKEKIDEIKDFYVAIVPNRTRSGKKTLRNLFPGYVFIELVMTDDIGMIIRNTEYVTDVETYGGREE